MVTKAQQAAFLKAVVDLKSDEKHVLSLLKFIWDARLNGNSDDKIKQVALSRGDLLDVPPDECMAIYDYVVANCLPVGVTAPVIESIEKLCGEDIPPPKWIVPNLLTPGLTIIAGKPKIGKSWMALDLALSVAGGGMLFGEIECPAADVLYLALEDNKARLQSRVKKLLAGDDPPKRFDYALSWPRADQGGLAAIEQWLKQHPKAALVIVDTFVKVRTPTMKGASLYESDTAAVSEFKKLADTYGVAVVLIHHRRKAKSDDVMDTISGSTGVNGTADTNMVLDREDHGNATLHIVGRDIGNEEYALVFDKDLGRWKLFGAAELPATQDQMAVVSALNGHAMSPAQIAEKAGLDVQYVKNVLPKLCEKLLVIKHGHGQYVSGVEHFDKAL
jgi:hypothetical protein